MPLSAAPFPQWHPLIATEAAPEALVLLVVDRGGVAGAQAFADQWRAVVPRCAFAGFEIGGPSRRIAFAPVQDRIGREMRALGLASSQIILIGVGRAGQHALDLALCNALPEVHAIIVDLPPDGVVVGLPPAQGAFRFIQHRRPDDPDGRLFDRTIQILREACLDIRTMIMPDDAVSSDRALRTFLVELVARASRYQSPPRAARAPAPSPKDPA